jgi:hypothetical protein
VRNQARTGSNEKLSNQPLSSLSFQMELAHVRIFWMTGLSGAFARRSESTKIRSKARAFGMCCSGVGSAMKLERVTSGSEAASMVVLDDIEKDVK